MKKVSPKSTVKSKMKRRRLLTFLRMCRYGVSNFSRNVWLTVAATAIMAVTLLVIFSTLLARNVLIDIVSFVSNRVDMPIYLKLDTPQEEIDKIQQQMKRLDNVADVRYISPEEARAQQVEASKEDQETLEAIKEANNQIPPTLRVNLDDMNDTSSLIDFVDNNENYKKWQHQTREPSFKGDSSSAFSSIGTWVRLAEIGGGVATLVFVAISFLVVFNTIRMAIFNRKDEIHMMKLIGAERSFIRGPFLVEAMIYGVLAGIVATGAGYAIFFSISDGLKGYGVPIEGAMTMLTSYTGFILLGIIAIGVFIGIISSFVATQKYLKL